MWKNWFENKVALLKIFFSPYLGNEWRYCPEILSSVWTFLNFFFTCWWWPVGVSASPARGSTRTPSPSGSGTQGCLTRTARVRSPSPLFPNRYREMLYVYDIVMQICYGFLLIFNITLWILLLRCSSRTMSRLRFSMSLSECTNMYAC